MAGSGTQPSSPLLAANRRLQALRVAAQSRQPQQTPSGPDPAPFGASSLPWDEPTPIAVASPSAVALQSVVAATTKTIMALPDHLGWGSEGLTAATRRQPQPTSQTNNKPDRHEVAGDTVVTPTTPFHDVLQPPSGGRPIPADTEPLPDWVKLYPDIGLGMLRQELTAPGRLWLMLRYLDREGRGLLRIDNLADILTKPTSPLHLCGKRQLRNLLRDGVGIFWSRDSEHIWLRSAAKVAAALDVERLTGRPVALPLDALLSGIGDFRAHLYTAFFSGRIRETSYGIQAMPVARETLAGLSGVGRSSQRTYEGRTGVAVQANFAVGGVSSREGREMCAWQKGQALFEIKDYRGQQGKRGKTYLAWQLPNSYVGQHQRRPKGRQKRINRELKDLVTKGTPGNCEGSIETYMPEKRYYPNGKLAALAYGRDPHQPHYWHWQGSRHGRFIMWQQVGG